MLYEVITIFANKELIEKIKLANALEEERERLKIVNQIQVSLLDRIEGAKADIVAFNNSSQELVIKDYRITSYNVCYTKLLRIGDFTGIELIKKIAGYEGIFCGA